MTDITPRETLTASLLDAAKFGWVVFDAYPDRTKMPSDVAHALFMLGLAKEMLEAGQDQDAALVMAEALPKFYRAVNSAKARLANQKRDTSPAGDIVRRVHAESVQARGRPYGSAKEAAYHLLDGVNSTRKADGLAPITQETLRKTLSKYVFLGRGKKSWHSTRSATKKPWYGQRDHDLW